MAVSPNFAFLEVHDPQLVEIGTLAEKYFKDDPVTCLIKLRQFGESLARLVAAKVGLYTNLDESQLALLNRLQSQNLLPGNVKNLFHQLRKSGNNAVHQLRGDRSLALNHLRYARELSIWFHQIFGKDSSFEPSAFTPPSEGLPRSEEASSSRARGQRDPEQEKALKTELARLRKEAEDNRTQAELAEAKSI